MSNEFEEIVVPVDGSEGSQRAAEFAARLARATGSALKLLYVFQATPGHLMSMARLEREDVDRIKKQAASEAFASVHKALGNDGDDAKEEVLIGDPAAEIVQYINARPKALVVMGRRGMSRMETLLMGSVSEKVVRHAAGPVTVVH